MEVTLHEDGKGEVFLADMDDADVFRRCASCFLGAMSKSDDFARLVMSVASAYVEEYDTVRRICLGAVTMEKADDPLCN